MLSKQFLFTIRSMTKCRQLAALSIFYSSYTDWGIITPRVFDLHAQTFVPVQLLSICTWTDKFFSSSSFYVLWVHHVFKSGADLRPSPIYDYELIKLSLAYSCLCNAFCSTGLRFLLNDNISPLAHFLKHVRDLKWCLSLFTNISRKWSPIRK